MKKIGLFAFAILLAVSCKKKEDVIALTEKQKLILGKWQQIEVIDINANNTNVLGPCETANPTIFEFKTDGKCYVSSPNNACFNNPNRVSPYAISADGSIIVIEGLLYQIQKLDKTEFIFTFGSPASFRQKWVKMQ